MAKVVVSVPAAADCARGARVFSLKGHSRAYLVADYAADRTSDLCVEISAESHRYNFIRKLRAKICRIRVIGWLARGTIERGGRYDEYWASEVPATGAGGMPGKLYRAPVIWIVVLLAGWLVITRMAGGGRIRTPPDALRLDRLRRACTCWAIGCADDAKIGCLHQDDLSLARPGGGTVKCRGAPSHSPSTSTCRTMRYSRSRVPSFSPTRHRSRVRGRTERGAPAVGAGPAPTSTPVSVSATATGSGGCADRPFYCGAIRSNNDGCAIDHQGRGEDLRPSWRA